MNEILKTLNSLTADELESLILRANIILDKKRKEEAEQKAQIEKERRRQEMLVQEKRRQQEIAELQRKLNELQSQPAYVPEETVNGNNFDMCGQSAPAAAPKPAQAFNTTICPYCGQPNAAGSTFCVNCGQKLTAQAAPRPVSQPVSQSAPQPAPASAPSTHSRIQYADENMNKWVMLPGEKIEWGKHDAFTAAAENGKKYKYYIEITNMRLLFTRESAAAANAGMAARMGGGLLGAVVASGLKSATNSGPKPYMAIPLSAITNHGREGKKEYFIEAGERFVIQNHQYYQVLPTLIEKAKTNGY